ncbi:hypothetical protein D3C81_2115140 [compost metagenome]
MDSEGKVYVDYSADIMSALGQSGNTPDADQDLRTALEPASYYVPVKSLPYLWIGAKPVPQPPHSP